MDGMSIETFRLFLVGVMAALALVAAFAGK